MQPYALYVIVEKGELKGKVTWYLIFYGSKTMLLLVIAHKDLVQAEIEKSITLSYV